MKEIMGGLWLGSLVLGTLGLWAGALVLCMLGVAAGAAAWYDELRKKQEAESWRKNYPSYKY